MKKYKQILIIMFVFISGIIIGGYMFAKTQPRSFISLNSCDRCVQPKEQAGLVGSAIVTSMPILIQPVAIMETDKTVVIKNPAPEANFDYVIIPRKDIKDVGDLSNADKIYLDDAYAVIERLIDKYKLRNYQVVTYGPDRQQVRYLHFHLKSAE